MWFPLSGLILLVPDSTPVVFDHCLSSMSLGACILSLTNLPPVGYRCVDTTRPSIDSVINQLSFAPVPDWNVQWHFSSASKSALSIRWLISFIYCLILTASASSRRGRPWIGDCFTKFLEVLETRTERRVDESNLVSDTSLYWKGLIWCNHRVVLRMFVSYDKNLYDHNLHHIPFPDSPHFHNWAVYTMACIPGNAF